MTDITAFERLLQILLPMGGQVAIMMEAYFDESGTDDGSPVMCVAGYLFEQSSAIEMTKKWSAMLKKYNVPYVHMKELAPCKGVCSHLDMTQCDSLAREAYSLIHEYMTVGYAISIETEFMHLIPSYNKFEDIYSFACWQALMSIRNWANQNDYHGKISYFFEAGHKSQSESNSIMNDLMEFDYLRKSYRYNGHSFVQKKTSLEDGGAPLLQTGDILAWHHYSSQKRKLKGAPDRKDYEALVYNDKHFMVHYDERIITKFVEYVKSKNMEKVLIPHDWNIVMGLSGLFY